MQLLESCKFMWLPSYSIGQLSRPPLFCLMLTLFSVPICSSHSLGQFLLFFLKKCSLPDLKGDNLLSTLKDGKEPQGPLCLTILPLQQTNLIFKMNQCMNVKISESLYFWNYHESISFHVSEFFIQVQALSDSSLPDVVRIVSLGIWKWFLIAFWFLWFFFSFVWEKTHWSTETGLLGNGSWFSFIYRIWLAYAFPEESTVFREPQRSTYLFLFFFHLIKIYIYTHLFIWLHWVLVVGLGIFYCSTWTLQLWYHRLQSCWASEDPPHSYSCSVVYGVLVLQTGIESESPALPSGFLTTGPPGKSLISLSRRESEHWYYLTGKEVGFESMNSPFCLVTAIWFYQVKHRIAGLSQLHPISILMRCSLLGWWW